MWLATPLTCGLPCIACYDGIILPFLSSSGNSSQEGAQDVFLEKAQKRLMSLLLDVRRLLRRGESLDLVLEAELCWPTLDSSISLAQCVHAVIGDEDSPFNTRLVNAARLHVIDVLPSLSHRAHYHRAKNALLPVERCFDSIFGNSHVSSELHVDVKSPMSERNSVLWQLFFGKEGFAGSNIYCSHYRNLKQNEFQESKLENMFYGNRILKQGAVLAKQEGSFEVGIVYNAIRFVQSNATRLDEQPAFQYSPRLFQEEATVYQEIRSYFLKCRTPQGVLFDVLSFCSNDVDHALDGFPHVQIIHFGFVGTDGKPHLAVVNTELLKQSCE
ncbi:NIF3 protein [Perkinsela sp. CCAP 1560/4]|nr:NIF3 protein [Perkinsela sp. CCAP 1560/4]|eukprot:KNH07634.1 NIF3 protein [Perkinsela sp. CCAP 1560/4]